MQEGMVRLTLALVCVMTGNIVLGAANASFYGCFCREKFFCGIKKAVFILLGALFLYLAAYLTPHIIILEAAEASMTLMDGLHLIVLTGFIFYGAQTLSKLAKLLGIKVAAFAGIEEGEG